MHPKRMPRANAHCNWQANASKPSGGREHSAAVHMQFHHRVPRQPLGHNFFHPKWHAQWVEPRRCPGSYANT